MFDEAKTGNSNQGDISSLYVSHSDENVQTSFKLELADECNKPKISILGLGYVGAVSSACFSDLGYEVVGVDLEEEKVSCINKGQSPIVEEGLAALLHKSVADQRLKASSNIIESVKSTDVTLVSVGTPSTKDGGCDLTYLKKASEQIGIALSQKSDYHLVIFRSTVPPHTTRKVMLPIIEKASGKRCGDDFGLCFNPEFLRESTAIEDFYHPPETVIGSFDQRSADYASKLYETIDAELVQTSLEIAELVKYVDNTWHALKVTFANEIGRLCKSSELDSQEAMTIFMKDRKLNISPYYLKPGFAFGGSCLPKDTRGIMHMAASYGVELPVINHIIKSNDCHIQHALQLIEKNNDPRVLIVGLTFKAGTDDMRESPAVELLRLLVLKNYRVQFYDPCIKNDVLLHSDETLNKQMNACRTLDISQGVENAKTLVITHGQDYAEDAVRKAPRSKNIIDVTGLDSREHSRYQGICW